jgi:biotin transport system substrate-specific component
MLLGSIAIYAMGVPWLMIAIGVPGREALELGLYPFVIGDTVKLLAAAAILPAAWKVVTRFLGSNPPQSALPN